MLKYIRRVTQKKKKKKKKKKSVNVTESERNFGPHRISYRMGREEFPCR
jgi:hypothetical protein